MQILPNAAVLLHCRPAEVYASVTSYLSGVLLKCCSVAVVSRCRPAEVYAPVTNYLSGCIVVLQCCSDPTL